MTNNKQQTAVDQIVNLLNKEGFAPVLTEEEIKSFKEMEKEQHGKTWDKSMDNLDARGGNIVRAWVDFDEYYNKTFGGDEQ
jgi:hypothetical protein